MIARGLFVQAMAVISEFGYEGLRTESLLKLTSRMLIRCDMAEDEELLALASDIYRHGKYDEVDPEIPDGFPFRTGERDVVRVEKCAGL